MANWNNPALTSTYANFLNDLKARDEDLAKQYDGQTTSNLPTGAIRWNSSVNRWQKWTGSAWGELTALYALTGLSTTGNAAIGGTLTVTGVSQLAAGTAAAPGLGIGEATTGLFRPSAGILGIAANGVEAVRVDGSGRVGFAYTSTLGGNNGVYRFHGTIGGNATSYGINLTSNVGSDAITTAVAYRSVPSTVDGISGVANLRHFQAEQGTITGGTRGAVANQIGFFANGLNDATNNYGFYANSDTATGHWNFYAAGTAANYVAGDFRSDGVISQTVITANQNSSSTASASSLRNGLRTGTPTANITLTMPTGTDLDAAFQELQTNQGFQWSTINLAAATFTITIVASTGHTLVGNMVVAANTSARFLSRKTSANTFVTYRIA